jgi:hypothetical protein
LPKLVGYQRFEKCLDFRVFPAEGRAMGAEGRMERFFSFFFITIFFTSHEFGIRALGTSRTLAAVVRSFEGLTSLKKMAPMLGRMDKNRYFETTVFTMFNIQPPCYNETTADNAFSLGDARRARTGA